MEVEPFEMRSGELRAPCDIAAAAKVPFVLSCVLHSSVVARATKRRTFDFETWHLDQRVDVLDEFCKVRMRQLPRAWTASRRNKRQCTTAHHQESAVGVQGRRESSQNASKVSDLCTRKLILWRERNPFQLTAMPHFSNS